MTGPLSRLQPLVDALYGGLPKRAQDEITLYATAAVAALNLLQAAALPLPPWAHVTIGVVSVLAGAVLTRGSVTPLSKSPPALSPAATRLPQ